MNYTRLPKDVSNNRLLFILLAPEGIDFNNYMKLGQDGRLRIGTSTFKLPTSVITNQIPENFQGYWLGPDLALGYKTR